MPSRSCACYGADTRWQTQQQGTASPGRFSPRARGCDASSSHLATLMREHLYQKQPSKSLKHNSLLKVTLLKYTLLKTHACLHSKACTHTCTHTSITADLS